MRAAFLADGAASVGGLIEPSFATADSFSRVVAKLLSSGVAYGVLVVLVAYTRIWWFGVIETGYVGLLWVGEGAAAWVAVRGVLIVDDHPLFLTSTDIAFVLGSATLAVLSTLVALLVLLEEPDVTNFAVHDVVRALHAVGITALFNEDARAFSVPNVISHTRALEPISIKL